MSKENEMFEHLNLIIQEIVNITELHPDGSLVYIESDEESYEAAIFMDERDHVRCYAPSDELFDIVIDLWALLPEAEKWAVLEIGVDDGKLNASFTYPDSLDPNEDSEDRRERALRKRYGDKPVIYPDDDDDFVELTLEDFAHLEDNDGSKPPQ